MSFPLLSSGGCWTAADNARLFLGSAIDDKERAKMVKEGGAYSGVFKIDFIRNCAILGVVPHPQLVDVKRVRTVADEEREEKEKEAAAAAATEGKKEEAKETEALPAPAPAVVAPSPPSDSKKKPAAGTSKGRAASAEKTPAQRIAAELATLTASLTTEELKPVTELSVRGWTVDVGTAAALQLTIPACKHLTTLRFWNASLNTRAITLLADSLKGSTITKLLLDYNPLASDQGQEPGLAFSMLLAPSSPLQLLSLRGNRVDDAVASEIARTASGSRNLVVLDLFENEIGDHGAAAFAKTLGLNTTLQSLNLSRNRISDAGGCALASAFQSVLIVDKEEAKTMKKAGFKVTTIKNRTMREANQHLKSIHLSHNYLAEEGLRAWLDVTSEQIKYTPSKGLVIVDGAEVVASTLVPPRLLPPPENHETGGAEASEGLRRAGRRTDSISSNPTPSAAASKPSSASASSAAAAAAAKKEEEDLRYPGQLNHLTQINLTHQYSKCTELTWHQLRHTPAIRWTASPDEEWQEEGTLNVYAMDLAAAREQERLRLEAQSEEERAQEAEAAAAAEAAAVEEAARVAAEAVAHAKLAEEKKARKERKQKGMEG